MAISETHYRAIRELHERGELHQGGTILEIGEANYYGDMPPSEILADIEGIVNDDDRRHLEWLVKESDGDELFFDIAKGIYLMFWGTKNTSSIDMNGTQEAMRLDLNNPIDLRSEWNTVINHGTAEHIFNIANVFKVMHDHCKVGGLMIHESPFTGWVDHGFYTLQPTLFFDVAAANGYDIRYIAIEQIERKLLLPVESREQIHELAASGELPNNAMLYVAMRKMNDEPFRVPMQGIYSRTLSPEAAEAWKVLR